MRNTKPGQGNEIEVAADRAIVSKTDLSGKISYVNPYLLEISGYGEDELLGQHQDILRHPDMPESVTEDMWRTIQSGQPWVGLEKNRCKDGAFYWVRANITPVREAGRLIGYMSVRGRPEPEEIAAADQAYAELREGRSGRFEVRQGEVVRTGAAGLLRRLSHSSLRMRIWLSTSLVNVLMAAVCILSLTGHEGPISLANYAIFCATFIGLLVNVYLWHTLRVDLLQPLARSLQGARAIAAGDLSCTFDIQSGNEMGQMQRALQQMKSNLIAIIRDVRDNVETMAAATREIAAGNLDLSGRTEAQAASLEQTASSVEQFSATVKQNADSSQEASALAEQASSVAVEGGIIVSDVIATMESINASSKEISDIIGLIEGIAFQTNILALNAAVEAARAGEQGRGFAVVAGEVRHLAQRSATAAKDIKHLIDASVSKVSNGMVQVHSAGTTMEQVVKSVQKVTTIMQDIAVASREQSIGVDQVNSAIAHMDKVTQENAALVERAATAANSLAQEAFGVTQAISLFKFGATGDAGVAQANARQAGLTGGARHGVAARTSRKAAKLLAA